MKGLLSSTGITDVFHYAPLHYLLFIAREAALLSKTELRRFGYEDSHFRRTSRRQDDLRGFSTYVHLTLMEFPPILEAKLRAGFPHFEVRVPAHHLEQFDFHLCRFNIAKSRYLRRDGKPGPPENRTNGRYYGEKQLPTAETANECQALLSENVGRRMIEVLVPKRLPLGKETNLIFFNADDLVAAERLVSGLQLEWKLQLSTQNSYAPSVRHTDDVRLFLERANDQPSWRGNGLDFDYF